MSTTARNPRHYPAEDSLFGGHRRCLNPLTPVLAQSGTSPASIFIYIQRVSLARMAGVSSCGVWDVLLLVQVPAGLYAADTHGVKPALTMTGPFGRSEAQEAFTSGWPYSV